MSLFRFYTLNDCRLKFNIYLFRWQFGELFFNFDGIDRKWDEIQTEDRKPWPENESKQLSVSKENIFSEYCHYNAN